MYPYCLLLDIVAGLIFSIDAVISAISSCRVRGRNTQHQETPDITKAADNNARILRRMETHNVKDADTNIDSKEMDGQGFLYKFLGRNDLKMIKLSRMMKDEAFKVKMFRNWDKHQQSIGKIRKMMFLDINPQYQKLLLEYLNNYQHKSPKVTKSTASVHSPGNSKRVKWADPLTDVRKFDADPSSAELQFTWVIWPCTKWN